MAALNDRLEVVCHLDSRLSSVRIASLRILHDYEFGERIERDPVVWSGGSGMERVVGLHEPNGIFERGVRMSRYAPVLAPTCYRHLRHFYRSDFCSGVLRPGGAQPLGSGHDAAVAENLDLAARYLGSRKVDRHIGADVCRSRVDEFSVAGGEAYLALAFSRHGVRRPDIGGVNVCFEYLRATFFHLPQNLRNPWGRDRADAVDLCGQSHSAGGRGSRS